MNTDRSLEDRSHPLLFDKEGRLDGLSIGRHAQHKPMIFGVYATTEQVATFIKGYCIDGLSAAAAARVAGIDERASRRIVKNGGLRSAADTQRVNARRQEWRTKRERHGNPQGKWIEVVEQIVSARTDHVEVEMGHVPTRADCVRLRGALGHSAATRMFRWSVRPSNQDAECITVQRIGAF